MQHSQMRVVMGSSAIKAFVAAPKSIKVLGIVRIGLEFGLLGMDGHGNYVRVNGSQIESLDRAEVRLAMQIAHECGRESPYHMPRCNPDAPKPVVAIRKRRHLIDPLLVNPQLMPA